MTESATSASRLDQARDARLLDGAVSIGHLLCENALWQDGRCTWDVHTVNPEDAWSRQAFQRRAGPYLYQGTAGIALFLSELAKLSGERRFRDTAAGALRFAESQIDKQIVNWGFHIGKTGVAYALARHGTLFEDEGFIAASRETLVDAEGGVQDDAVFDVMGGAAGIIPALAVLADWVEMPQLRQVAIAYADHLIAHARLSPYGWSWPCLGKGHARDLLGMAHGAAGCGASLLEAYAMTNAEGYRYGAELAFAYEREFYDEALMNWPDFRNAAASEALARCSTGDATLIQQPPADLHYQKRFMLGWCHGAPGIGLTRLRAYELTGLSIFRTESLAAIHSTFRIGSRPQNYSLCHGLFGNNELLIAASRVLEDQHFLSIATDFALEAIETYGRDRRGWPSGSIGGTQEPSLLLGDAGIGHHLLRLYAESVRSVLHVVAPVRLPTENLIDSGMIEPALRSVETLRSKYVNQFFRGSIKAIAVIEKDTIGRNLPSVAPGSEIRATASAIKRALAQENESHRADLMREATELELAAYDAQLAISDYAVEHVAHARRQFDERIRWGEAAFELSEHVVVKSLRHDWLAWSFSPSDVLPSERADESPVDYLIHPFGGGVRVRQVTRLAAAVLSSLTTSRPLGDVIDALRRAGIGPDIQDDALKPLVVQQLESAYRNGLINVSHQAVRST